MRILIFLLFLLKFHFIYNQTIQSINNQTTIAANSEDEDGNDILPDTTALTSITAINSKILNTATTNSATSAIVTTITAKDSTILTTGTTKTSEITKESAILITDTTKTSEITKDSAILITDTTKTSEITKDSAILITETTKNTDSSIVPAVQTSTKSIETIKQTISTIEPILTKDSNKTISNITSSAHNYKSSIYFGIFCFIFVILHNN
jgi:hypothetical protein